MCGVCFKWPGFHGLSRQHTLNSLAAAAAAFEKDRGADCFVSSKEEDLHERYNAARKEQEAPPRPLVKRLTCRGHPSKLTDSLQKSLSAPASFSAETTNFYCRHHLPSTHKILFLTLNFLISSQSVCIRASISRSSGRCE